MTQQEINKRILLLSGKSEREVFIFIKKKEEITLDILMRAMVNINLLRGYYYIAPDMINRYIYVRHNLPEFPIKQVSGSFNSIETYTESLRKAVSYCVENMEN
jgi:hypothetical protein